MFNHKVESFVEIWVIIRVSTYEIHKGDSFL